MRNLLSIIWVLLIPLWGGAYELRDICLTELDVWGCPTFADRKSGEIISENPMKTLHKIYGSPNFQYQKAHALATNDQEGVINLCLLWAYVVPATERVALRNEIVKNVLKINLEKKKTASELIKSEEFLSPPFYLDSRLNLLLGLLLSNKVGTPLPAIGEDDTVYDLDAKIGLVFRPYLLGVISGESKSPEIEGLRRATLDLLRLRNSSKANDQARLFLWVVSCEFGFYSDLKKHADDIDEIAKRVGDDNRGVRLVRALLKKDSNKSEFEAEIIALAESLFPPAYPFMESVCRTNGNFSQAAYYRYLHMRNPWSLNEFIELCPTEGVVKKLLTPISERFFCCLVSSKDIEEAYSYGTYTLAVLERTPEILKSGRALHEKISRDLIVLGKNPSGKDTIHAKKLVGNDRYINRKFELTYAKALSED